MISTNEKGNLRFSLNLLDKMLEICNKLNFETNLHIKILDAII